MNSDIGGCICGSDHTFMFLRQERQNISYDRSPVWLVRDVFFCSRCLEYNKVDVEKRTPRSDSLTEEYIERLV